MDAEARHLLIKLSEECAEVQQAVSKALLFGLNDSYKDYGNNHDRIVVELHDVLGVLKMLSDRGIIILPTGSEVDALIEAKEAKVLKYMQYAKERGHL